MRVSTTKTTVTLSVDISLNLRVFEGREHDREFVLHFHQDKVRQRSMLVRCLALVSHHRATICSG